MRQEARRLVEGAAQAESTEKRRAVASRAFALAQAAEAAERAEKERKKDKRR
jgi:hypothetical protein